MPIGKPISNMTMYVLDQQGEAAPIGVQGELYIGGIGVARGYWERPDLTAERFVPDEFAGKEGARLYRTGDRVRVLGDGNMEFLGRMDHQVKIRGYRIEPAEVEAVLSGCAGVNKAMVVVREDEPGEKRLVGYVGVPGGGVEAKELREYLRERLPEYMVPTAWVIMEELPVRGSGKIDPKDLPRPETVGDEKNYVAPRTEVEKKLAGIWEELLGAQRIGIHDNFFELGGHSLLVMQLMVEVQQSFGVNISLQDVFMSPTLAKFTDVLKRGDLKIKHQNLIPIRAAGTEAPLFIVHSVGGGIDYVVDLAPFFSAVIPVFGLQATGFAPGEEPLKTVEEMAELYLDSIRQVQPHGPYRLAGWSAGGIISYEMARRLIEMGEQVEFLGLLDTNYSQPEMPAKDFDPKSEMIDVLSSLLTREDLDGIVQLAQTCDFEALFEGSSHVMDKIAKAFPSIPILDASAARRVLAVQHAIRNAVYNYSFVRLSLPVWLFEATGNTLASAPDWRSFLGDDIQVVPVQGTHATMVEGLENLKLLGATITEALALNSIQIA